MEKKMKLTLWLLLLSALPFAPAAQAKPAPDQPSDPMTAFNFVIGVWKPVPDPAKLAPYSEEYTFAPMLEGKFLISQELFRDKDGKVIYRDCAVFGVDPDTHKLFLHAYNTDGSMDRTHGIDSPPGQWIFLGTVYGSKQFRDYRYTLTKLDENHLRVLIELLKDGKYVKHADTQYERTSKEPVAQIQ
jgi:hypothetical protein